MIPDFKELASQMKAPDWIQVGLLVVQIGLLFLTSIGLFCTAAALREQTRSRDFENYLSLKERFTAAWRQFAAAAPHDKQFEFLELMNLIESICHLCNKKVIRGATRQMVCDYLRETLPAIFQNKKAKKWITSSFTGPDTFFNIRRFANTNNIQGVPHQ